MANEATLPTEEEIAQLPRWARVAFAARCARRVLPLLLEVEPEEVFNRTGILFDATQFVETSATGMSGWDDWTAHYEKSQELMRVAFELARALESQNPTASDVAEVVWLALDSMSVRKERSAQAVSKAVRLGEKLCGPYADVRLLLVAEYSTLTHLTDSEGWLSQGDGWVDSIPMPHDPFDAMWPDGFPTGWPVKDSDGRLRVAIDLSCPSSVAPEVVGATVVKLWEVANEYHMARGGGVLTFDEFKQMMPALVPVGPESRG